MSDNITLPRATVEQALEALEAVYGDSCDAIHALRFELAQQAEPVEVPHRHEWFSTGGMEPGRMRCIHCGVWGRSPATLFDPRGSLGEPIV